MRRKIDLGINEGTNLIFNIFCKSINYNYLCYKIKNAMTQIVVTLDKDADSKLLLKMIENMKGVLKASIKRETKHEDSEADAWISKMKSLSNSIDPSIIDMNDERSRYIMGK